MRYTNTEVARQIVISYFENLTRKGTITSEGFKEVMAIKRDKTNKVLLEHIKAIKSIMEDAIKEIENNGD